MNILSKAFKVNKKTHADDLRTKSCKPNPQIEMVKIMICVDPNRFLTE